MRLIDADDLIDRATNRERDDCWDYTPQDTADFVEYINQQPTENSWIEEIENLEKHRLFDDDSGYVKYSDLMSILMRYYVKDIKITG